MKNLFKILILTLFTFSFGQDCDDGYTEIDGTCYYQSDLDVLQSFIDLNQSLNGQEPLEIGDQEWNNTRLTYLGLGNRSLTTIPDNIGNLNYVEYLFLSSNQFSILPESMGDLSSLKFLFLSHNQFSILPESIGNLSNLETLYLHDNQLNILPETICNLSDCYIYVNDNQLCPPYPECLSEEDIGEQDTSECEEPSLCNEGTEVELWGECYNIEETTFINFSYQEGSDYPPLSGEIPSEIGQLVNMTDLFLGGNDLTIISPEIGNLINLQSLYLYDNEFTSIPSEIGNLTNLITLDIGYNQLTGEIPSELGNLTNLTSLDLGSNQLTGEIPLELGNLDNLYYLNLSDNQLSGQIPESICVLSLETYVGLNWNSFCPPYPDCGSGPITSENSQDTSECVECSIIPSDLNNDLSLNVMDVILMVGCVLSESCDECSDFNEDGSTDILDIVDLVNVILGQE